MTVDAESLEVLWIVGTASAEWLNVVHVKAYVGACGHEWLPSPSPWKSSRLSTPRAPIMIPTQYLKTKLLPLLTLTTSSCIQRVVPLPVLTLPLLFGEILSYSLNQLRKRIHCLRIRMAYKNEKGDGFAAICRIGSSARNSGPWDS